MFGVRSFTAVINPPQVAILAVGAVARSPVETGAGGVAFRDVAELTLTADHRAIYGADAARFLAAPAAAARAPACPRPLIDRIRSQPMTTIDFRTAVREALDEELAADDRVIFFGEDVALAGGVFAVTPGLYEKYGGNGSSTRRSRSSRSPGRRSARRSRVSVPCSRSCSATS